jgi:hypothetical protein
MAAASCSAAPSTTINGSRMLFARMRHACGRRLFPLHQLRAAFGRRQRHGLLQPAVERMRCRRALRVERAQVVETQPAADNQHTLLAQRQQAAHFQMRLRIQPVLERQLHDRHVRLRIHRIHRAERAMVETALRIEQRLVAASLQQLLHLRRQLRRAGRRYCTS